MKKMNTEQPKSNAVRGSRFFDVVATLVKIALFSCLVASISVVLYSSFAIRSRGHWLRYPDSFGSLETRSEDTGPTNISHIVFGIGALARSWRDRSRYTALWFEPNITRGFAWLDKELKENTNQIPYRVSENLTRLGYPARPAVRIARIVLETVRLGLPNVRWFVFGDDDTVYYTHNLVTVLAKYDHNQMYYIGANSESVEQDVMHSYDTAFGGGGFAVSYLLAVRLVKVLDGCLKRYDNFYGSDERIGACISEVGVPLTQERGFHQLDIRGDPYGLLAAHPLVPLVSLHHLDYLTPLFPNQTRVDSVKSLIQSYKVDPSRTLQTSFCYDRKRKWSVSIAWGYTVQIYPSLVTSKVLQTPLQTFKTWRSWKDGPFTFNTRLVGAACEKPVVYFLNGVQEVGTTGTLTSYGISVAEQKMCDEVNYKRAMAVHRITVSAMKLGANFWNKAPRRQCCEIMDRGVRKETEMKIRIRRCRARETVST